MVTAPALIHGDADRLLEFNQAEHSIALQIGGSDPYQLAQATRLGCDAGYDEININIGCPSDRVQSGRFGACLMKEPELVSECVSAMLEASTGAEITVKCRIGVDEQDPKEILPDFIDKVSQSGVNSFAIHARKAWLSGLSPKQNRDVPPLDYNLEGLTKWRSAGDQLDRLGGNAWRGHIKKQKRDAFVLGPAIVGASQAEYPVSLVCVRSPDLGPVHQIMIATILSAGLQAGKVGTSAGL